MQMSMCGLRTNSWCSAHVFVALTLIDLTLHWSHLTQDVLRAVEGRLRCSLSVAGFLRMEAGEGIEREQKDFAAEVAHAAGIKT
jgi:hypothetical protein